MIAMRRMEVVRQVSKWLVVTAFVALGTGLPQKLRAETHIALGITSLTAFSLPLYIAEEKGLYAAHGLDVDIIVAGQAASVIRQLTAGSLDMAQAATDQSLRGMLQGAPIRIIAGAAANAPFRMVGGKGVVSWRDLKGKVLSVGGPTDVTLYFLRVMARRNGLKDTDYDLIYAGGTPQRFAQLASGGVAGAMLTNPLDFTALEQGYVDLGIVPEYLPHWAQNNLLVAQSWAASHRAAVVAFLRAEIAATDFFYAPAHRDAVIAILVKFTKAEPATAAATYDFYLQQQVIAPKSALFEAGIQHNLDAFVEMGELQRPTPPLSQFIDPTYLAEAAK
jgi:NitT/TauT family transport system substrate-binding protein